MMLSMFYPTGESHTFHERQYFAKAVQLIFETARGFLFSILLARKGTIQDVVNTLQVIKWDANLEKHIKTCILRSGNELTEQDLDVSMIYHVIRNAKVLETLEQPTKKYGKEPGPSDLRLGDDIERCRIQRNRLCHSTSASMSENEFKDIEKILKDIFHRWSNERGIGMKFLEEVDRVVNSNLTITELKDTLDRFFTAVKVEAELEKRLAPFWKVNKNRTKKKKMKNIQTMVSFSQSV